MFLLQDLQYGWRQLLRSPGFLVVAVASLALGIGANTAIFSLLNSVLMKQLPVRDPEKLVMLTDPGSSGVSIGSSSGERGLLSYPEFQDLQREGTIFDGLLAAESSPSREPVKIDGAQQEILTKLVSGSYFPVFGVRPAQGRFFDESVDTQLGAAPYAVISNSFWERRFSKSPAAIGKTIVYRKALLTVIGVAPAGFFGETVGQSPDVWAPLSMQLTLKPGRDWLHPLPDPNEKAMWLHVFGRLKPGITLKQASAEANAIFKRGLEVSYQSLSPEAKKQFMDQHLKLREAATGASDLRDRFVEALTVLFVAVGITLLICCANITNLLLARANSRRREITVRLALGASKGRVIAQLFTESLLLAVLGATGGLAVASFTAPLLVRMASNPNDPIGIDPQLDWRVLAFTGAVAVMTTLIFGLVPAYRAAKTEIQSTLRESSRGLTATMGRLRLGRVLVMGQVALSLILLVGAGLFLRTLLNLQRADLGYAAARMLLVRVDGEGAGYKGDRLLLLYRQISAKLSSMPGVSGIAYSDNGLFGGTESGDEIKVEGYTSHGKNDKGSRWDQVSPGYFSIVGIPILLGREINDRDQVGSPLVCVINEAFAKLYFTGRNPLGKHVTTIYGDKGTVLQIVGVAKNSRDHSLRGEVPPRFFVPLEQNAMGEIPSAPSFEIRTRGEANTVLSIARRAIAEVDSNVAILNARSLGETISLRVRQDRALANLTAIFGGLALLLAAIGIYGVLAYGVSQRTGEIGIRMAVGASVKNVLTMVLRETAVMVAIGLAVGVVGSYFVTRLIESRLVGLKAMDPMVLASSLGTMIAIGLIAAYGPAWRASRIDPASCLRNE